MESKYIIPKFAPSQIFPSTDEELSSIIMCLMPFNIHLSAIHFSVCSKKYTHQMIPFQFKFMKICFIFKFKRKKISFIFIDRSLLVIFVYLLLLLLTS